MQVIIGRAKIYEVKPCQVAASKWEAAEQDIWEVEREDWNEEEDGVLDAAPVAALLRATDGGKDQAGNRYHNFSATPDLPVFEYQPVKKY